MNHTDLKAKTYRSFLWIGLLALSLLVTSSLALAQRTEPQDAAPQEDGAAAAPLSTAFTYQGRLSKDGTPVDDTCDFTFTLLDAASGGQPLDVAFRPGVTVDQGIFAVQLDFGATAFEGETRYLEIEVDCGEGSTTLSPPQELTAAPYAIYAPTAGSAQALQDQPLASSSPNPGDVLTWNGLNWSPAAPAPSGGGDITAVYTGTGLLGGGETGAVTLRVDFAGSGSADTVARSDHHHDGVYQPTYARTVIVSPVGDGSDQQANGTALLDALSSITDASRSNPYLVKIEPGIYDVGSTPVTMKAHVDIEGSGIGATEIKSSGFADLTQATVIAADDAELRMLTVTSDGDLQDNVATAILADRTIDFRIDGVRVQAWDALAISYGIRTVFGGGVLEDVSVQSLVTSGGTASVGIANEGTVLTMQDVRVESYNGQLNVGVSHADTTTPPEMSDVDVSIQGGSSSRGIFNDNASPILTNVNVEVSGAEFGYAIHNGGTTSAPVLREVTAVSSGSGTWDYGLYNGGGSETVQIDRSTLSGSTHSIRNGPQASSTLLIGASQLDGPINNDGGGTFTCVASYDGSYAPLNASCQ